ncbi:MAG: tripartite tricarboxylate transporter substrate binding protein [Spirochaetales bacterium]|nr:tripartite tricarboxylate transporter substrate binding protein [Spirochaetales bacterium]
MKKTLFLLMGFLLLVVGLSTVFAGGQGEKYPSRDITNILVWSAGGGTDTCNRVVMAEMQKVLGVNITVVNKPGGVGGSVGMNYAYSQPHDGYTLCGLSESCVTAGVQGGFDKRMNVWDYFIIGGSPDVVSVTPDTPYKTIKDLIEAGKANPGAIKAGASAAGSIHHLNLLALMKGSGAKFNFIPYTGSAPAQNAAMTGEISVVVTSVAEQAQLIRGGKLRPLAVLVPKAFNLAGKEIPSAFDTYAGLTKYLPISQAIGFAVPADTPDNVKSVLVDAFNKAMKSPAVQKFGKDQYYILSGKTGPEAKNVFNALESNFAWTLWDLKAAKISPEKLGIPKP